MVDLPASLLLLVLVVVVVVVVLNSVLLMILATRVCTARRAVQDAIDARLVQLCEDEDTIPRY
jgi:hypothetical protein